MKYFYFVCQNVKIKLEWHLSRCWCLGTFLTYIFHKASTVKKWIFTSKELILFKWKFLKHKTQLSRSRQSFTLALEFLPSLCHCSCAPRQLMSAVHLGWRRGVANGWPCFAKRNAVNSCEASPTAFQRTQLQWQDLGKKSKADVKLWRLRVNWVLCFKNFHLNRINSFEVKIHFLTVETLWKT